MHLSTDVVYIVLLEKHEHRWKITFFFSFFYPFSNFYFFIYIPMDSILRFSIYLVWNLSFNNLLDLVMDIGNMGWL